MQPALQRVSDAFCPIVGVESDGHVAIGPHHHGALYYAGKPCGQRLRRCGIGHVGFFCVVQLAPRRAFAVDQYRPIDLGQPLGYCIRRHTLLFEVVELHIQALRREPGAGLFDRVTVGNTKDLDRILGGLWGVHGYIFCPVLVTGEWLRQ